MKEGGIYTIYKGITQAYLITIRGIDRFFDWAYEEPKRIASTQEENMKLPPQERSSSKSLDDKL